MFTQSEIKVKLDAEINKALDELKDLDRNSEEYDKRLEFISKLHKLKAEEGPKQISRETMFVVAANLVGVLIIVGHEHVGPVTSKALTFLIKAR